VLDFMAQHPYLPATLMQHPVNRGLGRTRNDLAAAARGEYVFMLDSDNEMYPTALARLVEALDADEEAFFAYPMLEVHADGRPETLRSFLPWEPELLLRGNYIDAMALLRREILLDLGGYAEDLRLYGWEDYELWCRAAERGLRGVLVPQILTRYRRAEHSMLAVTDVDSSEAESILRTRYRVLARTGLDGEAGETDAG
jgi:GT2 family glycosyltransferase